ncbi:Uncharacterised protein (plasmid) [Tsukamurella tyrosinosolvens]|uniref:Uncharacterized protein n=1 Tax=Tsukamurella tyrosinosolvens TaxID=57704 RepID=A0A1H4UKM3_TSUTY|nr:hypothetical protein [Tsukamurella tyrosinosolvens]KXO92902.1 hypothetical protein AXK58_13590 [Tsukamurella tyrosinosolvens]SEC68684.1 hypothetical protein SAMN04489793_2920 [Tsukamurella tyrosinosolvens]VEH94262.1 Uncharacterised protein [Tsukamurella tyrosinosolvens]
MITADTVISLDADPVGREPMLARWNRTRNGRASQSQGTAICLHLWDAHASSGWDGGAHATAGALRAFEFALAEEVERQYRAAGADRMVTGFLDAELDLVTSRHAYAFALAGGLDALASTIPSAASSALFASSYRSEHALALRTPCEDRHLGWRSARTPWSAAARRAPVNSPEWVDAVARAHALRSLVHALPRMEAAA